MRQNDTFETAALQIEIKMMQKKRVKKFATMQEIANEACQE